ncbi:MAG TPA: DUF6526 family protein [Candidatus Acidoferrales bacterium]|nr:DUF6526 family protein [Candidatus Acidoferrales bacterium]
MAEQNFQNHVRRVPLFHFFTLPVFLLNFIYSIYHLWKASFSFEASVGVLVAAALIMAALYSRLFALSVQDRVIRLEMRLRMERILPADLKPRIEEFTVAQLIALRFASDAELPELARRVLNDKLADRKTIKQMVKNWNPDYMRA